MDDLDTFDPALFGPWCDRPVYGQSLYGQSIHSRSVYGESLVTDDPALAEEARSVLLETKSADPPFDPAEELRRLLNEMTVEMRDQFATFRNLRASAEKVLADGDEAAQKLARADVKAATDAMSLIVRTLEKVDSLQRQLARDREIEAERVADEGGYEEAKARFMRMIHDRATETALDLFEAWKRDGPPPDIVERLRGRAAKPADEAPGGGEGSGQGTMAVSVGHGREIVWITEIREKNREASVKSEVLSQSIGQSRCHDLPVFPLAGKMSAELTDGGGAVNSAEDVEAPITAFEVDDTHSLSTEEIGAPPPSVASGDTSPARGEAGYGDGPRPSPPSDKTSSDEDEFDGFVLAHERDWLFKGRGEQKPAEGDWRTWLIMGGRGSGKTRAGAEWVHALASAGTRSNLRIALVAETLGDAREVMVDGVSGICRIARKDRPEFEISRRRLVWKNGAVAQIFSSEDPEALRGPQFHFAWCDELAKWKHAQETFDMLQFGLRLGADPRQLVTTTPRPVPVLKQLIADPGTHLVKISTRGNAGNLSPGFIETLERRYGGTRLGRQELAGELIEDREDALWKRADLEACVIRFTGALRRIVVAVDPPSGSGENSCCGIVVAGLETSGRAVALADCSVTGASPAGWARAVAKAYHRFQADRVVAEVNQGGEMVTAMLRSVDAALPVTMVRATRGKFLRAEPVAALYEQGRVAHAGRFTELEDQMCDFGPDGLSSGRSPDRLDALVWALTALLLEGQSEPRVRGI